MEVILMRDLLHAGKRGEVIRVKPGFARNYLIPQGIALDEQQKDYIVQAIALWLVRRGGAREESGANLFDPDRGL